MSTVVSSFDQRRIGIRFDGETHDIIAPAAMSLSELLSSTGTTLRATEKIVRERSGELIDPAHALDSLVDGEVISIVDLHRARELGKRRSARGLALSNNPAAAWWMMGTVGVIAAVIFFVSGSARPQGWAAWVGAAIVAGAVISALLYVRRPLVDDDARGAFAWGPASVVGASAVIASPPGTFSTVVTVITIAAMLAVFFYVVAAIARNSVEAAQIKSFGAMAATVGVTFSAALVLDIPDTIAATAIVGAAPLILRILPTTLMHVPPGLFIDFAEHQQSRFAVREVIPEAITTVDTPRVTTLVARSLARMTTVTFTICALVVCASPLVFMRVTEQPLLEMIGTLVLAGCVTVTLVLTARRFSSRSLKSALRATAFVVMLVTLLTLLAAAAPGTSVTIAIVALVLGLAVGASVVLMGRGARSVWWSRFGDIVEGLTLVFSMPAALIAAGVIGVMQGAMN